MHEAAVLGGDEAHTVLVNGRVIVAAGDFRHVDVGAVVDDAHVRANALARRIGIA